MSEDENICKSIQTDNFKADVCVMPSKDGQKNDIQLIPHDNKAKSMRSTTELVNNLKNNSVPQEEIRETLKYTSKRLEQLR